MILRVGTQKRTVKTGRYSFDFTQIWYNLGSWIKFRNMIWIRFSLNLTTPSLSQKPHCGSGSTLLWQNFFYHICEDFRLQANKARPYYVRLLTLERGGNDKEKTRPFNLHADFSRVLPRPDFSRVLSEIF